MKSIRSCLLAYEKNIYAYSSLQTILRRLRDFTFLLDSATPLKPFAFNITEQYFANMLIDRSAVQDVLTGLESDESEFWKKFHAILSTKLMETGQFMEDKEEAQNLNVLIRQTVANFAEDTTPKIKAIHEENLAVYKSRLKKVQGRLDRRDSTKLFKEHVTSQVSDVVARGLENLAIQLGEWFATGAVGPGTVTYRDRTFTAE